MLLAGKYCISFNANFVSNNNNNNKKSIVLKTKEKFSINGFEYENKNIFMLFLLFKLKIVIPKNITLKIEKSYDINIILLFPLFI